MKKIKELFVQDLVKVQGGETSTQKPLMGCPEITTTACGEERPGCSAC